MSTQPKDGGPAFPATVQDDRDCAPRYVGGYGGMTLRDWFASMAMQGRMANPTRWIEDENKSAIRCYQFADAMLAARERKEDAT